MVNAKRLEIRLQRSESSRAMKPLFTFLITILFLAGCGQSDHQHSHDDDHSHAEGDHHHAEGDSDGHDHDAKPEAPTNVRMGTGLMTFDTVPGWGLTSGGKSAICMDLRTRLPSTKKLCPNRLSGRCPISSRRALVSVGVRGMGNDKPQASFMAATNSSGSSARIKASPHSTASAPASRARQASSGSAMPLSLTFTT